MVQSVEEISEEVENRKEVRSIAHIDEALWKQTANLIFCAGGTLFCYLWFGIIQESITKGKYGSDGKERFTYTQALVFVQCAMNTLFAYILRGKIADNVPMWTYATVSTSYLFAMITSNHALQYIPYPTQVLGKSCKPIPIMVFGFLFANKRYHWKKYCYVTMIVFGVALFLYKEKTNITDGKSVFSLGFGELLLLLSLAMDGTTGAIQDRIRQQHKANAHSMMYHMNLFSSFYLLIGLLLTGELFAFTVFVQSYPKVIGDLFTLAAASALGQFFIFKTVTEFGPLTCSIVTTTRKLFTMLGSVILFGNVLTQRQCLATVIVFTSLLLDAIESKKKTSAAKIKLLEDKIYMKFSSLIGTVYRGGNVTFSTDGNSVISPVGNKVTVFDLKNNQANTIAVESSFNIKLVTVHPSGTHAFFVNEAGQAQYVNLVTQTVLYQHHFRTRVNDAKFSTDGRRLAACRGGDVQVFLVAGIEIFEMNPFILVQTHKITAGKARNVEWSYDNKLLVVGSEDKQVRIVSAVDNLQNLFLHALAAHKAELISVDKRGLANHWTCALKQEDLVKGLCSKNSDEGVKRMWFDKTKRHQMMEHLENAQGVNLTASTYHPPTSLLITAFSNGAFLLHEAPHFNLIYSLRVSETKVSSLAINKSGDWIAIACGKGTEGQLVVWEWQSETYVMKQQSHSQFITTVAYSPDGSQVATGAEDGKVKVWSCRSSFCTVTFTEHKSGVSTVRWTSDGKALLSASLDGTVRAHDLIRYRNFRTLVCPDKTQLGCLAVDSAGDLVMASSIEIFNIYVWSLENGKLLDVLSGHSAPVSCISVHGTHLASASWDKTLRIWNVVESSAETIDLHYEALHVLCLDSSVSLFETQTSTELGTIEAMLDVDAARRATDRIKKQTSEKSRQMDINRRNYSEFGNMMLIDANDSEEEPDGKKRIKLPGTRHSDFSERSFRPEMRVEDINFSPTGRSFAVCSTEGVAVFSLDHRNLFNPFELGVLVTPTAVENALKEEEYSTALKMALQLNQTEMIENVLLYTPVAQIDIVIHSLSIAYAEKLLKWLAESSSDSIERHIHFWQLWLKSLLMEHGYQIKLNRAVNLTSLTTLQQRLSDYANQIAKLTDIHWIIFLWRGELSGVSDDNTIHIPLLDDLLSVQARNKK
uniref:Small-subunit processome Utp12 domain-containing protein n=1 Tax=Setaria digitata TaxID=48799 RepID=A0A915PYK6_9BILA